MCLNAGLSFIMEYFYYFFHQQLRRNHSISLSLSLPVQYTGPIPAERGGEPAMGGGRSETSALSGTGGGRGVTPTQNSQRPNACCFCWCCCCSCSW